MKILFQIPSLNTIYAGRTIYFGYKHAFEDLGHKFRPLSMADNQKELLDKYKPDIFIGGFGHYAFKYLDLDVIKMHKKRGMKVFVNIPFWRSPISKMRINENNSISENKTYIELIKSGVYGDVYYNICENGDWRMDGFEKATGYKHYTIPLAADKIAMEQAKIAQEFTADISFIGTYLSDKRKFFEEQVFPLKEKYNVRLYGQDWTAVDRMLGWIQRGGQYFNIPYIRSFQKPKLQLNDEASVYKSSIISINVHEKYQKKFGGDCNERTFKIPLAGGFEITDDVACIRKYFVEGKEIIIAKNKKDWFDQVNYYIKNSEKRTSIIEAGRKRVLKDHTYHNRVLQIMLLANRI